MNRIVVALSAVVSGRSAWLLLGVTGMAYTMGATAVWAVTGYITAEVFLFLPLLPELLCLQCPGLHVSASDCVDQIQRSCSELTCRNR